jgi:PKD repeat protein
MDYSVQPVQVGEIDCSADFVSYIDSANYTGYFTNRILGEATAMFWSFGDGKFSIQENPVHEFPGQGIYSVGLNTYDFNTQCMDYYEEMLLIGGIGEDCEADFAYGVDPTNPMVRFSNRSIGDIVSYNWNFGEYGSDNSTVADPDFTYIKGGYYNVCLTVTNSDGISNMSCKWVLVQGTTANDCRANFMFTIDSTTRKATFMDNSYGSINKYTWDFGDDRTDSTSIEKNPDHTYDRKGYYLVQLKSEDTVSGCVSNEYKLLNVAEAQILKAAFGYEAREPNKKVAGYPVDMVSASSGDGATVEWDFGDKQIKKISFTVMDSTSRIITHYYEKPRKYRVCLRISDPVSGQSDEYCEWVFTKNAIGVYELSGSGVNLDVYPNPFMDYTTISYALPKPQFIEITIYDQLGRKIETLVKSRQDSGDYQITWETKTLATGVYHLKLVTTDGIITKQLVVTK